MQKNNQSKIVIILIIVAVIIFGFFIFKGRHSPTDQQQEMNTIKAIGDVNNLVSFSVKPGDSVSGIVEATGTVQGGYFFEGNIVMKITDTTKKVLWTGHGTATTDWMSAGPVSFTTTLDFTGLPPIAAYIDIQNDNPSGDPANQKDIYIPVIIY